MEDMYTIINRQLVTQATRLDMMMDECTESSDYNDLEKEYRMLLCNCNLWKPSLIEESDEQEECEDDEDFAKDIYEDNGKFGIKETYLHTGIPAIYDWIEPHHIGGFGQYWVYKDGKVGFIELLEDVNVVFDVVYDEIDNIRYEQFVLKKDDKFIYWNDGRASEPFDDIHVPRFAGWIKVCKDGEWGWLDGNLSFTTNLHDAHEYILNDGLDNLHMGEHHDASREELNKCSNLDNDLSTSQESDYEGAEKAAKQFSMHICDNQTKTIFERNGKYGIKDFLDFEIIVPEYDEIIIKNDFTAYGRKKNHWGAIILDGCCINSPPIAFDKIPTSHICNSWQEVYTNGKWGLYDPYEDKYILNPVYDEFYVPEGYQHIILQKNGKYGFYDGIFTVPCDYEEIKCGRCLSFVRFKKHGKWGYIDGTINWVENIEKAIVIAKNLKYLTKIF